MLVPVCLLIIGGFAVYSGVKTLKHRKRVYHWPMVSTGKIISKTIGKRKLSGGGGTGANYRIDVEYEILVFGKIYTGHHYYAIELIGGERAMTYKMAEKMINNLQDPISVFYNPENPSESYMIKDHPWFMYFSLIVGILMLLASFIGFLSEIPV
jgi:hypothetical protein